MASTSGSSNGAGSITWTISGLENPVSSYEGFRVTTSDGKSVSFNTTTSAPTTGHSCGISVTGSGEALFSGTWHSCGTSSPVYTYDCPDTTGPTIGSWTLTYDTDSANLFFSASDASGVNRYEAYLNGVYKFGASVSADSMTFSPLSQNTTYTVSITVWDNAGNSTTRSETFTTDRAAPSALTGLTGSHDGAGTISLSWNASTYATKYVIAYAKVDGESIVAETTGTSFSDSGFQTNKYYQFQVTPYNGDSLSGTMGTVTVSTYIRPANFAWVYSTVSQGSNLILDHRDWNNLAARVNAFRDYKGWIAATFTTVSTGTDISAALFNEMREAISIMNPPTALPAAVAGISTAGTNADDITDDALNGLVNSLNSIL